MRDKAQEILSAHKIKWISKNLNKINEVVPSSVYIDAMEEYAAILVDKERAKHEFSK